MLKRISFIVCLLGITFLVVSIGFDSEPAGNLDEIEINSKVFLRGIVDEEREIGNFRILTIKEIQVVCNCQESYLGERVEVVGLVDEFNGERQIRVLEIR
jgi:hypothetical protein